MQILLQNRALESPAIYAEYCAAGGYTAIRKALQHLSPKQVQQMVKDAGLRGRGGAAFPAGVKWSSIRDNARFPRYVVANADEMEPGTFKDRVLLGTNPHLVIEGMLLAGFAVSSSHGIMFIRPSYENCAEIFNSALLEAREAGLVGRNIAGSDFSFEITIHRSAGRYICGEGTAQINAIMGNRAHPMKGVHMTERGLWGCPTLVNNVETLACVPHIIRSGPEWFRGLAASTSGEGTKLYCVSGKVKNPGCFELPMGTRLSTILEEHAGGMMPGCAFKACLPGGASSYYMTKQFYDAAMDFESLKNLKLRLGTGAIIVYDEHTCLVAATLNLQEFFARESCGFCTPCREGLPYIRELLQLIENGEGREEYLHLLRQMARHLSNSFCPFAIGASFPLESLLTTFEEEVREHISQRACPFKQRK